MSLARQVLLDSPAGYWPFNVDLKDISGNGRDGTAQSSAALGTLSPFGTVLDLAAGTQSVNVSDAAALRFDASAFSVEAWVNVDSSASDGYIGSKVPASGGGGHEWIFYYNAGGAGPRLWTARDGTGSEFAKATSAAGALTVGRWYHIVGTYSGAATHVVSIYVDGVLQGQSSSTTGIASTGTVNPVRWGAYNPTDTSLDGKLAHCAIFDAELSAARILAHYEAGRRHAVSV
jgi:hypothetical protein